MFTRKTTVILGLMLAACFGANGREYHVSPRGVDTNDGSASKMLRNISAAALRAQPGDLITVHEGVYRERINPLRGGESDRKRIVYRAAPGEKAVIKGSEVVKGWEKVGHDTWKVTLPNSFFGEFNPYRDLIHGDWFNRKGRNHHTGAVYLDGHWLTEAANLDEVRKPIGEAAASYGQRKEPYLLNVAWLRIENGPRKSKRIPAAGFAASERVGSADCSEGGKCIGWIERGSWVRYDDVDFGQGADRIEMRVSSASLGGTVEFRMDSPEGELLGAHSIKNTGGWQSWVSASVRIKPVSGVKTLCLVFRGPKSEMDAPAFGLWFAKVDESETTIWAQFKDTDPNRAEVEINVRQTVFYPEKNGVNYITVRGFTLEHAATPWSPPTAEQVGLIGAHWNKGWIIENNTIRYSTCVGVTLGKHGDQYDNTSQNSAQGYVKTIERGLAAGWSREKIGSHIVRNNHISHCEQAGIVGSLGPVFCSVTGNLIHDIHVRRLFSGAEMAGIKFHGAIDTEISGNHIYRTTRGIWLDWMTQGTRVTRNVLHDNGPGEDLFLEVNHGPFMVDHNICLSPTALLINSQGGSYAHNLMVGRVRVIHKERRLTPAQVPHGTQVAALHGNPSGDDRYYNNLMVRQTSLTPYDPAMLPVFMAGNVFLAGAAPSKHETQPVIDPEFDPNIQITDRKDSVYLELALDKAWGAARKRRLVTTGMLGKTKITQLPYEQPDQSLYRLDTDYFGLKRNEANPFPGPFEVTKNGRQAFKVWPVDTGKR